MNLLEFSGTIGLLFLFAFIFEASLFELSKYLGLDFSSLSRKIEVVLSVSGTLCLVLLLLWLSGN